MPIHFLSSALSSVLALETYPVVLAAVFCVVFLKQWSAGLDLLARLDRAASAPEEIIDDDKGGTLIKKRKFKTRDMHGNVILVVGGLTSQGLLVCSQLSSLGAQLILLTPTTRSSRVIQMIHLLRDGTSNPLIFAEECDITDMASVEAFAEMWNRGQGSSSEGGLGAGPAGDISASTGMGAISGASGGEGAAASSSSPRRIDSIIFMPLDSTHYSIGDKVRKTAQGVESSHAEVLGRFHLINKLLPTLLLLPPHRDLRIVSLVSPWYAAGLSVINDENPDFGSITYTSRSPWTTEGAQALLWLSLSLEMQRRIQLMTDADTRPRTKLPGIDDQGKFSTSKVTNVNLVNVCTGFERGRNVLDFLLPSAGDIDLKDEWEEGEDDSGVAMDVKSSISAKVSKKEEKATSASASKSAVNVRKTQNALDSQLRPSLLSRVIVRLVQYSIVIALWPFAWLLCKSPKRAAETVTWAAIVPMHDGSQSLHPDQAGLVAVPGELHREGRLLRPMIPKTLLPGEASLKIWKTEEGRIKKLLSRK